LCITGVPRLYKFTSRNIFENLININQNYEFDFIMCIQLENINDTTYQQFSNKYNINDILDIYKPKIYEIKNDGYQYDKLYRCVQLKNEYEEKNKFKYDLVMKIRFETYFFEKLLLDNFIDIEDNEIIVSTNPSRNYDIQCGLYNYTYAYINKIINENTYYEYIFKNRNEINHNLRITDQFITTSNGVNFIIKLIENINYHLIVFKDKINIAHEAYLYIGTLINKMKYRVYDFRIDLCHTAIYYNFENHIHYTKEFQEKVRKLKYDGSIS